MIIDYELLGKAQKYYTDLGYKSIETPWLVSSETIDITAPEDAKRYVVTKGDKTKEFVASGEQGFLYLALKGYLPPGKYVTIGPCLRNDNFDFTHVKQFMKCELIELHDHSLEYEEFEKSVDTLLEDAKKFFEVNGLLTWRNQQEITRDIDFHQIDLVNVNDTEVGSYGYREYQGLYWTYGTGLAEPRFSRIKDLS